MYFILILITTPEVCVMIFIKCKTNKQKTEAQIKQVAKATQLESNTIEIWPQVV